MSSPTVPGARPWNLSDDILVVVSRIGRRVDLRAATPAAPPAAAARRLRGGGRSRQAAAELAPARPPHAADRTAARTTAASELNEIADSACLHCMPRTRGRLPRIRLRGRGSLCGRRRSAAPSRRRAASGSRTARARSCGGRVSSASLRSWDSRLTSRPPFGAVDAAAAPARGSFREVVEHDRRAAVPVVADAQHAVGQPRRGSSSRPSRSRGTPCACG